MYTKDKAVRITLRLNEEQFAFTKATADDLGVSPSEFLRMVINSAMATSRKYDIKVTPKKEGDGRENDEADKHDFV